MKGRKNHTFVMLQTQTTLRKIAVPLAIFLLLIIIREPAYLSAPRIWAEEGSIYIQSYIDQGALGSLFTPHLGYYSFFNNFAIALSLAILDIQWVAYGTTYLSLTFALICSLAPFYLPSALWDSEAKKYLIVASSVLISTPEIWLNTINVQFYLGLFCCYLLLCDVQRVGGRTFAFAMSMLSIGALTSATSIILIPFYLIKAFAIREGAIRVRSAQYFQFSAILGCGLIVQLIAYLTTLDTSPVERLSMHEIQNLPMGLARTTLYIVQGNSDTLSSILAMTLIGLGTFTVLKTSSARYVVILILYVSLIFTVLSLQMIGGGRYGFIPSVLSVVYLVNTYRVWNLRTRKILLLFAVISVLYKLQFYFDTEVFYSADWKSFEDEFSEAKLLGAEHVRIFPHWEGTDWKIQIR